MEPITSVVSLSNQQHVGAIGAEREHPKSDPVSGKEAEMR